MAREKADKATAKKPATGKAPRKQKKAPIRSGIAASIRQRAEDIKVLAAAQIDSELEKRVWPELRKRLMGEQAVVPAGERREHYNDFDLSTRFNDLIELSLSEDKRPARVRLFKLLMAQLLPEEARILAAMSDNEERVLIHVASVPRISMGSSGHQVASNFSDVGRAAGLLNLDLVPTYLHHMQQLGLLVALPENQSLREDYDKLESDAAIRQASQQIESKAGSKARLLRGAIRLTPLGREFCSVCVNDGVMAGELTALPNSNP